MPGFRNHAMSAQLLLLTALYLHRLCSAQPNECSMDIVFAVDVSNVRDGQSISLSQPQLENKLSEAVAQMKNLNSISCGELITPRLAVAAFRSDGSIVEQSTFQPVIQGLAWNVPRSIKQRGPYVVTDKSIYNLAMKFYNESRHTTIKILVLFSDGLDQDVPALQRSIENLKRVGVQALITVALQTSQDESLHELEFGRGLRYQRHLQLNMHELGISLAEELINVGERICCNINCVCYGQPGRRGLRGSAGFEGSPGETGTSGHPGEDGSNGVRGPIGVPGYQGGQGCQGPRGVKGTRGGQGQLGAAGDPGLDGVSGEKGGDGLPGYPGSKGRPGMPGLVGEPGIPGEKGNAGTAGMTGERGSNSIVPGVEGERGHPGNMGLPGTDGLPADPGLPGPDGAKGWRGPSGLKGEKGAPGGGGTRGLVGYPGSAGNRGSQGDQGSRGPSGMRGCHGDPGQQGPIGNPGEPGGRGTKGERGERGDKGGIGYPGKQGYPGVNGYDGYGVSGVRGPKGDVGEIGYPGETGEPGTSGDKGEKGSKGFKGRASDVGPPGSAGTPGNLGPPGSPGPQGTNVPPKLNCEILKQIRENCRTCPPYPLELVFAVEISPQMTRALFELGKTSMVELLRDVLIARRSCPQGARVAVVTYSGNGPSAQIRHKIHFSDYSDKETLKRTIRDLPYVSGHSDANLTTAMKLIGRNTFKRIRSGILVKKMIVAFTANDFVDYTFSVLLTSLAAENISAVFVGFENQKINQIDEGSDTFFRVFVLPQQEAARKEVYDDILKCAICFDICKKGKCEKELLLTMDIAFVIDSSDSIKPEDFLKIKFFLSSLLDRFSISDDPQLELNKSRVALVQYTPGGFDVSLQLTDPVKLEFNFTHYANKAKMKTHIERMRQIEGTTGTGHAIKWTLEHLFGKTQNARSHRVIFVITDGEARPWDKDTLHSVVQDAKCKEFAMFAIGVGKDINQTELHYIASEPINQHYIKIDRYTQLTEFNVNSRIKSILTQWKDKTLIYPSDKSKCSRSIQRDQSSDTSGALGKSKLLAAVIRDVNHTSLVLEWNAPDPGEFLVTVTDKETGDVPFREMTNSTTANVMGLTSCHDYLIQIQSVNSGTPGFSYTGSHRTRAAPPSSVWTTVISNSSVALSWTPPLHAVPTSYSVHINTLPYGDKKCFSVDVEQTRYVFTGIASDAVYSVGVSAFCGTQQSVTVNLQIKTDVCSLTVDKGSCHEFKMRWFFYAHFQVCARFWYGGCGGNGNNFMSREECEMTCKTRGSSDMTLPVGDIMQHVNVKSLS
ncbi:collagen alpha-3(VI) chain-like [Lethenteron reissneri]|uniref:collagen alpha-3(VI) chain-like n=1 Tax=Lethenteron reissneri TaxID=7753 RepID=UPI002AB797E2|nr:collagen alpha-3(VI) chain-like [Lethenteron reissneri]